MSDECHDDEWDSDDLADFLAPTPVLMHDPRPKCEKCGRPSNNPKLIRERVAGKATQYKAKAELWCGLCRGSYFCNAEGVAEHELEKFEVTAGKSFSYTVYAQSPFVDRLIATNTFAIGDLSNEVRGITHAARRALESHFRSRLSALAGGLVAEWQKEGIYPYPETTANPVEQVSREVFDVCAQTVQELLPSFESGSRSNRKLVFRLLKQAIETDTGSLFDILEQVLSLEKAQQDALAGILKSARLGSVIGAAKTVLDRLKFLEATQHLFFGPNAGDVNEPHQLQQILLKELWLFGDEFSYGRQEAYLVDALEVHAKHIGRTFDPKTGAIHNIRDNKRSRLDLLLNSTYKRTEPYDFEHLVIELKRSSVTLGDKELSQIESYALTVAKDKRFDKAKTKWTWYLIGVGCDEYAEGRRMPTHELVERARIADPEDPDYVRSECVQYFVRRLDLGDAAFRDLFEIIRQRVLRAVPVRAHPMAGATQFAEKVGELEVREIVLQKFQELFCKDRREYDDRLDFFECRFNSALACLRKTAQEKVELDDSLYESTDFGDDSAGSSKEAELALLAMRDALDDRGLDFLYRSKLHAAINALPPDLRRVVELTFQEVPDGPRGGDAITICNLVGCTEKTVYNRRKKAFAALRAALKVEEEG